MIRLALALLATGFFSIFSAPAALAAEAAKAAETEVPMSTVIQNLHMNGYQIINKVELDNGVYAIDAMTPQGKPVSILMKGHTGEIMQPKQNPTPRVSLEDAVKRVEGSGYHDISKVDYSGGKYAIKALDQKNKKVKLKVDGATGEISSSWF